MASCMVRSQHGVTGRSLKTQLQGARAEVNTANLNVSGRAVRRASRKATWRLIPFLILCFLVAYYSGIVFQPSRISKHASSDRVWGIWLHQSAHGPKRLVTASRQECCKLIELKI